MRNSLNIASKAVSRALLLTSLALPLWSQPLQRAPVDAEGRVYFLEAEELVAATALGNLAKVELPDKLQQLYPGGDGWTSLLATSTQGLYRIALSGEPSPELVVPTADLSLTLWQHHYVAHSPQGAEVWLISAQGQRKLGLNGPVKSLVTLDGSLLLETPGGLWKLASPQAEPEAVQLPFPASELKLSHNPSKAVAWSPKSRSLLELPSGRALQSDSPPDVGVLVLNDDSVLACAAKSMHHFPQQGQAKRFLSPAGLNGLALSEWKFYSAGSKLEVFSPQDDGPHALGFGTDTKTDQRLPESKIRQLLVPKDGQGAPLLFLETALQEPEVDEKGRPVLDLKTGEARSRSVLGHKLMRLDSARGQWAEISGDPRAALVGPIELVGATAIYATQTEPLHQPGVSLEINRKYPYPAVIVRGQGVDSASRTWAFEGPRGSTPSKGRLPEHAWPVLGDEGPLLVTSEGDALLAIDPASGKLQWSSPDLPMDDSSPTMLVWKDGLALVATNNSTKSLLLIDPSNGSLKASAALNDTFFWDRWRHLLGVMVVCAALGYYIYAAGKRELYIRKIAGLQALDEAVGRATEMGKPVLYVVGLADVDDIQTLASLSILSHVARKTAEYDTPIVTTTSRAVTFSAAQEIVRDAYSVVGRPDAFSVESVRYISDDQFGYTAGVDGIMVREKPAANFYIGNFYAESLILAETGHATGSIQIAGTAQPNQLPFFVAACDYTLIGEELFAASAYLSRDPLQVGSLRGQDVGKMIVMVILVVCSLMVSLGIDWDRLNTLTGLQLP